MYELHGSVGRVGQRGLFKNKIKFLFKNYWHASHFRDRFHLGAEWGFRAFSVQNNLKFLEQFTLKVIRALSVCIVEGFKIVRAFQIV